jgi:hypothetical protein
MSWDLHHGQSEKLAGEAEALRAQGDDHRAAEMYGHAARAEEAALAALDPAKRRTRGITAVSAVSLWHKAGEPAEVLRIGTRLLSDPLPSFAHAQLREIIGAGPQPPREASAESRVDTGDGPIAGPPPGMIDQNR